jgi:tetratricopeptide (TPR) repeat protein
MVQVSESQGFVKQLMHRRVPQIVGAYIATLWLAVEIGGWVTEQLALPTVYALYLFVGLVALIPSVIVLAWRHGAPGPDDWGRVEKLVVPGNALLAIALVAAVIQLRPPQTPPETIRMEAAVIERTLIDETGQEQVFQVAREGYGVSVLTLFWPEGSADSDALDQPAWESYAAPWLLGVDLNRDPLINSYVIYDRDLIERLLAAGFEDGLGEPLSLGLSIAEDRAVDFLVRGSFSSGAEGYALRADIYAVSDGALLDSFRSQSPSLIAAVDALSERVSERLVGDLDRGEAEFRPVGLAEFTTRDESILEPFVRGVNALLFDADYSTSIEFMNEAVERDPSFAFGWAWLQQTFRLTGDMAAANAAIEQALSHDFKLDTEMRFILRANKYAIEGDMARAVRVIRMWTEVEPFSLMAWTTLTRNLLIVGEVDEAREANAQAIELDPDRASLKRTRAEIEELDGNFELAAQLLTEYLDAEPEDDAAWLSLGGSRERSGDIEGARDAYERASFVASNDFAARLSLMRLEGRAGDPEQALSDLRRALSRPVQPTEEGRLVRELTAVLGNLGRMDAVLEVIDTRAGAIRQTLPPLAQTLMVEGMRITARTRLGQFDQAMDLIEAAEGQLPEQFIPLLSTARIPVYEEQGEVASAVAAFEVFRDFVENYEMPGQPAQVQAEHARVLAMQDDYSGALARIDEAESLLRGTLFMLMGEITDPLKFQKATYLFEAGRFDEAERAVDDLLLTYPNNGDGQLLRARILESQGRSEEAEAQLAEVLALWSSADGEFLPLQEARSLAVDWDIAR